jgi:hypothetical protein
MLLLTPGQSRNTENYGDEGLDEPGKKVGRPNSRF